MNITSSRLLMCVVLCSLVSWTTSAAQGGPGVDIDDTEFLLLELEVQRLLVFDFEGYLYQEQLYLPASSFFSILKLSHTYQQQESLLEVRHPISDKTVQIDFASNRTEGFPEAAHINDRDYMIDSDDVYLRRGWVEQVFGFSLVFDYRKLKLMLISGEELPVIQNYRRRQHYETFSKDTRAVQPDIIQSAKRFLLNGWIANWTVNSSHNKHLQDYAYSLALGGHLLGGDLTVHTNGSRQYGFQWDQIRGQWRLPFYNSSVVQQLVVGDQNRQDVLGGSHMTFQGLTFTNRPKTPRREFGTYRLSPYLAEDWDVELYVNNILSDITIGSQQDSLHFSIPLRYGTNRFALKYYDSENASYDQVFHIQIPYESLPSGSVEYDVSAGTYRSLGEQSFANGHLKWGVSSYLTLGGGFRYLPEAGYGNKFIPYMQTWVRLGNRLIVEGSHAHTYLSKGILSYTLSKARPLRFSFKKYHQASVHNKLQKSLEISANTSFPLNLSFLNISAFTSGVYSEHQSSRFIKLYGGLSSSFPFGLQARFNSRLSLRSIDRNPLQLLQHTTEFQLSKRVLRQYLLRPAIQYDHGLNQILHSRLGISRRIFGNGFLSLSVQHNHQVQQSSFYLRFRLSLPYARHSSYVNTTQAYPTFNQSTSGTIALDRHNNIYTDQRNWVGKAAARIDPFLDFNNNEKKDKGEPVIEGLKADFYESARPTSPVRRNRHIAKNLTPYGSYLVQIDDASLDNPLWVSKYHTYRVRVSPNLVNSISVPIQVTGEITGTVHMQGEAGKYRMNGLNVYISDSGGTLKDTLRTYTHGSFYYVGLQPGHYIASLDQQQLDHMSLYAVKDSIEFVIEPIREGDIVEGINLEVAPRQSDRVYVDTVYTIQVGAFRKRSNATQFIEQTQELTQLKTNIVYDAENALYKCHVGLFSSYESAWNNLYLLQGIQPDLYKYGFVIDIPVDSNTYK